MDDRARDFVATSTLMFIASRNAGGAMDVSPRGGQPSVVQITADGRLLLPDYVGNRRLDTMGNVLTHPEVALLFLNRGADRYLRMTATAEITRDPVLMAAFPADENPPLSAMVFTPVASDFIESPAFDAAGFWVGPAGRKPPLDLGEIYAGDRIWQADRAREPVMRDAEGESALEQAGLRDHYGTPSNAVSTKVYGAAGPGFMAFIDSARFIVFARLDSAGRIALDLIGGEALRLDPTANDNAFLLTLPPAQTTHWEQTQSGECALLAAEPGRNENIRLNGRFRDALGEKSTLDGAGQPQIQVGTDEIYFHCSAAFARSRVWGDSRPVPWAGRRRFTCVARRQESPDVVSFLMEPQDDAPLGAVLPGQYVTVTLADDDRVPAPGRCYSVSATPSGRSLRISVRRVGAGGVSDLLHDRLGVGDGVLLGIPSGGFVLDSAPGRPVVLVSAGVGITPLIPMLDRLADEGGDRPVWFVHAARDGRHHLFGTEVAEIAARAPGRIRLFSAYSRPEPGDASDHTGRLDAGVIARLTDVAATDYYICGPDAFMDGLRDGLMALGASAQSIRTEAFQPRATGMTLADGAADIAHNVSFQRSGKTAVWTPAKGSLLDLALAAGIDAPFSCRNGECLTCVQKIIAGAVDYPSADVPFLAYGQVLLCTAVPTGDLTLDC